MEATLMTPLPRFAKLIGLTAIAAALWMTPTPIGAHHVPYCNRDGHYTDYHDLYGYQSSNCGEPVYCRTGRQHFEWDCVSDGSGGYQVQNFVAWSPVFCYCNSGMTMIKCC
jgi:hypothetical protein